MYRKGFTQLSNSELNDLADALPSSKRAVHPHLGEVYVDYGDEVREGQVIATAGPCSTIPSLGSRACAAATRRPRPSSG